MTLSRRRLGIAAAIAVLAGLLAALLFYAGRPGAPQIPAEALARLRAQPFQDLSGAEARLDRWQGKTRVVNFWATWCPPCRKEMPAFSKLHTRLAARGVVFLGVGIDSPSAIREYALQYPVSYPLLIGGSDGLDLMRSVGNPNAALPYTLVLDPDGQPVFSHLGMIEEISFEALLLALTPAAPR